MSLLLALARALAVAVPSSRATRMTRWRRCAIRDPQAFPDRASPDDVHQE
jgi:hypothetical protein